MNTASCEKEAPSLSRDEAIAILDTPDEELEAQSWEQLPLRALVRMWMLTRFPLYL